MTQWAQGGFIGSSNYDWSVTGSSIYVDGRRDRNQPTGIFQFDIATNTLSPFITSPWNDQHPSLSPANMQVAFVSDRSGRNEIWTYDINGEFYRQLTGSDAFLFDSRYSNLQWLDDNNLLITVFSDNTISTVTITVD